MTTESKVANDICAKNSNAEFIDYNSFFTKFTKNRNPSYIRGASVLAQRIIDEKPDEVSCLSPGLPNPLTFPFDKINVTLKDGTSIAIDDQYMEEAMRYSDGLGYEPLRQLIKEIQEKDHNIKFDEKRDLGLVYGAQDGIFKIFSMFLSPGDPIIVQHPLYPGAIAALSPYVVEYITAELSSEGLCESTLEKKLQERLKNNLKMPKLLYISPTAANPTSFIIPENNKREIYKLASKYNFLIIEDDPYYYIHYEEKDPISFLSMDVEYRVIRLETFSKVLCPGLRVGTITATKEIMEKLVLYVEASAAPSNFSIMIIYKLLQEWGYEKYRMHTKKVSEYYKSQRENMLQLLEKYCRDIGEWQAPKAGFFVWFRIKGVEDVSNDFINYCFEHLLLVVPGFAFSVTENPSPYLRISFALLPQEKSEIAIKLLADVIKKFYNIK